MIYDAWFRFKGIDSRQMGVIVTKMPETVRPERRVERITVAGRNGSLHIDEGVYESYDRTMECAIKKREKLDEIAAWLVGSGEMVFSTEPNKIYHVTISNQVSIASMMRMFQKFMVTMDTQPFKYDANAYEYTEELTEADTIINHGTVYAEPVITIYGTGDIALNVNGVDYPVNGVEEYITIDSEMMEVFKGDISQNSKYGGADFPRLEVGENNISWTGEVTKVEIMPKWRYL